MAKLTDSQLIVLSKATAREDGAAVVPSKMNKAAGGWDLGIKFHCEQSFQPLHAGIDIETA
jgi:hypothetical protein